MYRIIVAILAAFALLVALPALADGHDATIADIVLASAEAEMPEFSAPL